MKSEDKDRFDALMRLGDFRFQRWQDRRKIEWRVSLGLWALIAALIAALAHDRKLLEHLPHNCIVVLAMIFVVIVHAYWVWFNWDRNQKDINHAFYFADSARQLLPGQEEPAPKEDQGPRGKWGGLTKDQSKRLAFLLAPPCQAELGATVVLMIALGYVLWG